MDAMVAFERPQRREDFVELLEPATNVLPALIHRAAALEDHKKTIISLTHPHSHQQTLPLLFKSMIKEIGGVATFGQKELQNVLP